jgi:hypothetical protein
MMIAGATHAEAQSWRTVNSARQLLDREPVEVYIGYAAGELRVQAAESPMLYRLEMRYDEDHFAPITEYNADSRVLRLGQRSLRDGRKIDPEEGSRTTVSLTRDAPLDIDIEFGAGEANIELGGISLRRVDISTGASETAIRFGAPNRITAERVAIEAGAAELTVVGLGNARAGSIDFQGGVGSTTLDFSGAWTADADASVQMGIGSLTLRFPRGLGVRLNKSSFLTSFDSDGLTKRGDSYYSGNWDSAEHRLTIDVQAALGSIDVEWVN